MLYNETAIQTLIDRIGWNQSTIASLNLTISDENLESTSTRQYKSFHSTAIVENVYYCLENDLTDNSELNAELLKMKREVVIEVLAKIFDTNVLANYAEIQGVKSLSYATEYSGVIEAKQSVFDESIGWCMASKCLRMFLTTNRSNSTETNLGMNYDIMKYELDGIKNEYGRSIGKGTLDNYEAAVTNAINVLFPTYKDPNIIPGDGNNLSAPTLRGRSDLW